MPIVALRTPDDRFVDLPAWSYEPRYRDDLPGFADLRMHFVDEGPADAAHVYLCLHGQPSWAYLYRKMIPEFLAAGGRVVAPDLFGFGRSDKPIEDATYTFHFHRDALLRLVEALDLKRITLVVQDWGGLLGLTLPMEASDRYERVILMNTGLATGVSPGEGFEAWRAYNRSRPDLEVGKLLQRSTPGMSDEEAAAYDAPFPDIRYKAGVRRFPELVMTAPGMEGVDVSKRAVEFWREVWTGRSFMAIGMQDPVLGPPAMHALRQIVRGCPEPLELADAGHFVQEKGDVVARAALEAFSKPS